MDAKINAVPVFISSSDSYSDLWPIFFDLFKKYWPEYDGVIYLNTENKDFQFDGLKIICTRVGINCFGKTFRLGLDQIDSPYLLLVMIDYFFMGKVKHEQLNEYFEYFKSQNLDSLCLVSNPYTTIENLGHKDIYLVKPPSQDMFSYQIAFWKKSVLYEMALPHESPWLSEWYGTARANQMKLKLAFTSLEKPIPYLAEGALHKGKWVEPMISFLKSIDCQVNFNKRGFFEDKPVSIHDRIKHRINTFLPRCLSNLDLIKRRFF